VQETLGALRSLHLVEGETGSALMQDEWFCDRFSALPPDLSLMVKARHGGAVSCAGPRDVAARD
jgi:hypothetical protein